MKNLSLLYVLMLISAVMIYGWFDPDVYSFPKCPFRTLTGWLCPGCGSQRAIHQALQGNFTQSFQLNPLFLPAVSYALTGALISILAKKSWPVIRIKWYGHKAAWISLIIIVVFWIGRNLI